MAFKMKYQGKRNGFPFKSHEEEEEQVSVSGAADDNIISTAKAAGEARSDQGEIAKTLGDTASKIASAEEAKRGAVTNFASQVMDMSDEDKAKAKKKLQNLKTKLGF